MLRFERIDFWIARLSAWTVIVLMAVMTFVILLGVYYRYLLNDALTWSEEVARYSQVWLTMIGAGLVLRTGNHVAINFVVQRLPSGARWVTVKIGQALMVSFLLLMLIFGGDMTRRVMYQESAALEISMSLPNLAIPVGAALMIYHLLVQAFWPLASRPSLMQLIGGGRREDLDETGQEL